MVAKASLFSKVLGSMTFVDCTSFLESHWLVDAFLACKCGGATTEKAQHRVFDKTNTAERSVGNNDVRERRERSS